MQTDVRNSCLTTFVGVGIGCFKEILSAGKPLCCNTDLRWSSSLAIVSWSQLQTLYARFTNVLQTEDLIEG